jgi:hypothetical protein
MSNYVIKCGNTVIPGTFTLDNATKLVNELSNLERNGLIYRAVIDHGC